MNKEREKSILEIAIKEKAVTVKNLAQRLYSSEPSIRRDLCSLEKQGLLKRTHGGAVLNENALNEIKIPFLIRELEKSDEKIKIKQNDKKQSDHIRNRHPRLYHRRSNAGRRSDFQSDEGTFSSALCLCDPGCIFESCGRYFR